MRNEVPIGVATFVGREPERAQVAGLVTDVRLVTLIGSAGCGKTRLAMEVAGEVGSQFADGACWVELQGVRDPATVAAAVGEAVGVRERPGQPLVETLAEQLRDRHLLVVLDNCEHLAAACAALVGELMSACPRLHVLATSREPLELQGETTFGVPPLGVPEADARTAHTVGATDAGRLFEVRARQVRPDFALTDDDAAAVATICRRLDGIPLAIELAAARMRVLAPTQIAAGLVDRFRLLTGGGRDVPARQRSLEASVGWSFGLLADDERLALTRLSVFAGAFDLAAAQAVVAGPAIDERAVLDLVGALADHSLVQVGEHRGVARYRLLETIRLFAQERLAELDDPARVRDRHLEHYIALSERAGAGLTGADGQAWTARLAADFSDLRAAMAWGVDSGRPLAVLDIAAPTLRFWLDRGWYVEMERWLHAVADAPAASDADRARGLLSAALVVFGGGRLASAYGFADRAVGAARAVETETTLALSLGIRAAAGVLSGLAGSEEIAADADEAVALAARLGDDATHAYLLTFVGGTVCSGGSLEQGRRLLEQAVTICEDAGIGFHLPAAHALLGTWLPYCGEVALAREHARRGVERARGIDRPGWEAVALSALAGVDLLAGDIDAARGPLADAQALLRSRGLSPSMFEFMVGRCAALTAYRSGATDEARQVVEHQRRVARERGAQQFEAWTVWLLGLLALTEQRPDDAREQFEQCRALSAEPRHPLPLGRALLGLAGLEGDPERAWELAHDGLAVLTDFGDRVGTAEALETVAGLAVGRDHHDRALRLLAAAERFHDETGIVRFPLAAGEWAARHEAAARAALDDETSEACWADGTDLSLDEAVAYARRGRGERVRPQSGWASLTPAEIDLVRLVAQGCTNAEIGERLFMSVNTVKKHLSHVYTKLDVDGRADLAAEVARRDL